MEEIKGNIEPTSMPFIIIEDGVEYYPSSIRPTILSETEILPPIPQEGGE